MHITVSVKSPILNNESLPVLLWGLQSHHLQLGGQAVKINTCIRVPSTGGHGFENLQLSCTESVDVSECFSVDLSHKWTEMNVRLTKREHENILKASVPHRKVSLDNNISYHFTISFCTIKCWVVKDKAIHGLETWALLQPSHFEYPYAHRVVVYELSRKFCL